MSEVMRPLTFTKRLSTYAARWLARGVRVSLAWAVVLTGLGVIATRVSIAGAADAGMNFSDELMRVGEHHVSGDLADDVYTIEMNGQTFHSSNAAVKRPMNEVLDYFQDRCRHNAGGLRDTFGHLNAAVANREPTTGASGALVLRRDDEDRGYVFCVAPDHELSTNEILTRLHKMGRSSDLHEMGDLRYIAVRQEGAVTQIVTAWTEGPFNLLAMYPTKGDVRGEDFGGVPRPDGARRVFSGYIEGSPFAMNSYEVHGELGAVLTSLDLKLTSAGWRSQAGGPDMPASGRFYALGNSLDLVVSATPAGNGLTNATYVVSRNIGHLAL